MQLSIYIHYLHNTKSGGVYLKSIFFLPERYGEALKLMYILWYKDPIFEVFEYQIAIGLLLGYNTDNIIYFCNKMGFKINKKHIKIVKNKLKKLKVSLEMLQKNYKIVRKTSIESL